MILRFTTGIILIGGGCFEEGELNAGVGRSALCELCATHVTREDRGALVHRSGPRLR